MSEVTYDALRKRLAEAEEELSIWRSVFPDIAPERVLPDRSLQHKDIADLKAALHDVACHIWRGDWHRLRSETRAILDTMERKS